MRRERPVSRPYALRFIENRFSLRGTLRIVVLAAILGGVLNGNSTARAADVAVFVAPVTLRIPANGAAGLFVPGAGATVTREDAIASLERGSVENALLGGKPSGRPRIRVYERGFRGSRPKWVIAVA